MLFNGRALIFTFSRTQVRIAEHERLQSLFKMSMVQHQHCVGIALGVATMKHLNVMSKSKVKTPDRVYDCRSYAD